MACDAEYGTYLIGVRGRGVGVDGNLRGGEITITAKTHKQYPAVVTNGAGGYVVAWQEGATNSDIAATVVDGTGQVLGSGAEALSAAANTQAAPALSYDAARGRYLAVWADYRNSAEEPDVYGQLYRDYTVAIDYRYDALHRLTEATYSTGLAFAYEYDAMNNWLTKTETTPLSGTIVTTYTYNAADQLVTARSSADGIVWHYTFDDRGSLRRQTPGGTAPAAGEIRYSYDAAGQLVAVELYVAGDYTTLATAAYDGRGERARLTTWAEGTPLTITYVLDWGAPLVADDGAQATRYLYGRGFVAEHETAWVYDLLDGVGSVRLVVDESGALTLTRAYKPFGGLLVQSGGYETAFGYLGAQLDRVSGLMYVGGRYYDPATGRFLTPARGRFDPYHPRRSNPYVPWQGLWLVLPVALLLAAAYQSRKRPGHKGPWPLLLLAIMVAGMGMAAVLVACGPTATPSPEPWPSPDPTLPGTPELPTQPPTPEPTPDPSSDEELLRHTVIIVPFWSELECFFLCVPESVCNPNLGTIYRDNNQVVSHGHYAFNKWEKFEKVALVSFGAANNVTWVEGDQIGTLTDWDNGTWTLVLPLHIGTGSPALAGDPEALQKGTLVKTVYTEGAHDCANPNNKDNPAAGLHLRVMTSRVDRFETADTGEPMVIFEAVDPSGVQLRGGDSGGGSFTMDGRLIGNSWFVVNNEPGFYRVAKLPAGLPR